MKEVDTLRSSAVAVLPQLDAALEAIRACALVVNKLGSTASLLQADAQDAEATGTLEPRLRAFLDGSLLQRTGYVNIRSSEFVEACRRLCEGVRTLRSDCESVVDLINTPN